MYASATEKPDSRKLVEEHGPLVRRIAYHLLARLPSSVNVDDLVQSGMIGLLEAAAAQNRAAFAEIVTRHYQPVYRLVWRMTGGKADCEDITQEAFLRLWRLLKM